MQIEFLIKEKLPAFNGKKGEIYMPSIYIGITCPIRFWFGIKKARLKKSAFNLILLSNVS